MLALYLIIGSIVGYAVYIFYKYLRVPKSMENIPTISFFQLAISYLQDVSFDEQVEKLYMPALERGGGIAKLWRSGRYELMVSKTSHVKRVASDNELFLKKPSKAVDRTLLGRFFGVFSLFSADDEVWRRHRRVMNPSLKQKWSTELFSSLAMKMVERIEGLGVETPVIVLELLQALTLDGLGLALLGYSFRALESDVTAGTYIRIYHDLQEAMFNPIYFAFPFLDNILPSRRAANNKLKRFKEFMERIITEHKVQIESNQASDDLLTLMIKSSSNTTSNLYMDDPEILGNLSGFFLAGHDTTANTITSTLYFLAKYQDIQEKVRAEIVAILGSTDANTIITPTFEQQKDMKYLDKVIKESMRIITTVPQLIRYCEKGAVLDDGLIIPPKTFVNTLQWAPLHDEKVYPNPNHFNPDRFSDNNDDRGDKESNWIPFGYGGRMCAGMSFSLTEQRVVYVVLLQKFNIGLGPITSAQKRLHLTATGLVRPSNLDIIFTPRV